MKLLVATSADENIEGYSRYTLPIQKMWAEKWGADHMILSDTYFSRGMWCYRTLKFYDLLTTYDKILYVDADVIINENCPNPFVRFPFDTIAAVTEDKGSRLKERRDRILRVNKYFGDLGWRKDFFNMGFYLVSKLHRDMFRKIDGELWEKRGFDSPFYSYQIMRLGYKWIDMGYRWNHMSMFSENWNGSPSRFDSHILHYAGAADFPDKGNRTREQLIKDDIIKIYGTL